MLKADAIRMLSGLKTSPGIEEKLLSMRLGMSVEELMALREYYYFMPYIVDERDKLFKAMSPEVYRTWKKLISVNN